MGNRFVLFPIKYATVFSMYKKALSAFWTTEEIDLSKDMEDWVKLSGNEQDFIKNILAFFAASDGIVNENLAMRFYNEVPVAEVKLFYGTQLMMEGIHCVTADTKILTDKGHIAIGTLENKMVNVWNGEQWSNNVMVMKTSDAAPVLAVELSNGLHLTCTPNHEWLLPTGRVPASELVPGQLLAPFAYPASGYLKDELIWSNVELHGRMAFWPMFEAYNPIKFNCRHQFEVPLNYGRKTQLAWLEGALSNKEEEKDKDKEEKDKESYTFVHEDEQFLHNVQLMLTTLNVQSTVSLNTITFAKADVEMVTNNNSTPLTVTSIKPVAVPMPVYCFEEPHLHQGMFNGILTGQSETYSLLLDTYIKDKAEKEHLLNAIDTVPAIKKKAEWSIKWISDQHASFAKRLVAFACVEGIFFSGAFCSIFWLKERGLLPGLCLSNEFISRDESLHTEFATHLYSLLNKDEQLDQDTIHQIIKEAVEIEDEFINESINCNMLGMNTELMSQYIHFMADRLVVQLGYDQIFGAKNPFPFMERISLSNKSNFFEHTRQSDYARARVGVAEEDNQFALDADF